MDANFAVLLDYLTRKRELTQVSSEPLERKKNVCTKELIQTKNMFVKNAVSYSVRSIALTCTG